MGIFSLIKPLKKYEDYVYKAGTYEILFLKRKAIKVMRLATEQNFSKEEISSGLIYLGLLYSSSKEYQKASDCYNKALELVKNENFKYSVNFKKIIQTFIKNGEQQKAQYWLENLLQRQNYDKNYKKLAALQKKENH
ncbi:tetratricopeptide repeat protein [Bacillus idriensis]|uniref:Tetratricopeptide repeat protein n=1 Tax=Metabacillus idriensis TaxID=324768 RepID=A0A6I2MEA2_9BACI|nr:tetratricopeptide repeat protein [Metabacillus idriensis]MRX56069.1 tetratricopeptide repeat protein [Metabacillus idriensis]